MPKIKLEGMEKLQVKLKKNVQMSDICLLYTSPSPRDCS